MPRTSILKDQGSLIWSYEYQTTLCFIFLAVNLNGGSLHQVSKSYLFNVAQMKKVNSIESGSFVITNLFTWIDQ